MRTTFITNFEELAREKFRRENRRFSERAISRETGVARGTVRSYLRNEVNYITRESVVALCDWLDCSLHDLIVDDLPEASRELTDEEIKTLLPVPA